MYHVVDSELVYHFEVLSSQNDIDCFASSDLVKLLTDKGVIVSPGVIHRHDYYEFEYVSGGNGIQWINGCSYPVKKGDAMLFFPTDKHAYYSVENLEIINCCIHPLLWAKLTNRIDDSKSATVLHLYDDMQKELGHIIGLLETECYLHANVKDGNDCFQTAVTYCVELLLILLKRTDSIYGEKKNNWGHLLSYLSDHYATATLDEAADLMYISKNHFCKLFRQKMGCTLSEYLNELRIKASKDLLLYSDIPICDVWRAVGFRQAKQFNKVFLNMAGVTPSQYRKEIR